MSEKAQYLTEAVEPNYYPDWATIETPWDPQPIAWRHGNPKLRGDALRDQVNAQETHIVREVIVADGDVSHYPSSLSTKDVAKLLDHTDDEFELMRSLGLAVPEVKWYIFDDDDIVRTLARVPIIEGQGLVWDFVGPHIPDADAAICQEIQYKTAEYENSGASGMRLGDIKGLRQWTHGINLELAPDTQALCWLHDVEPVYW